MIIMNGAERVFGGFVDEIFRIPKDGKLATIPYYQEAKAVVSFLMACIVIVAIGCMSTFFLVRRMIHFGERMVSLVPLIKFFYTTPKEVLQTFTHSSKASFKRVVMLEYPRKECWVLGFVTGELIKRPDNIHLVAIFVPTTPNPTSGFMLLLPHDQVLDTNVPVEDGVRLIISGGILAPDSIMTQRFAGMENQPNLPPLGPLTHIHDITEEGDVAALPSGENYHAHSHDDNKSKKETDS